MGCEAERLDLALQAAGFGEWKFNIATGALQGSPLYRTLFGFSADQPLTVADIHARYHPEDRRAVAETLGGLITGRAPEVRGEFRLLLPDGTVRWVSMFGRLFRDPDGFPARAAGVVQDITQRKQAEEALRQSEERFRIAVRAVAGVVYDWDLPSGQAFRSHGLEEIVGLAPETVPSLADWWSDRIHPEDQARLAEIRADIRAGRIERYETEYRVRHEDGHWVHLWDRGAVLRDDSGRPVRVVGSAADVTQRKNAERALSESEQRFRLAAGAVVGMVYDWDAHTGRVFRSEGLFDLIGVRSEEAPVDRQWWWSRIHPEDVDKVSERRAEILGGGLDRFEHGYRIRHENGSWIEILDRGAVLRDEAGRTHRIIGTVTDVTQRRQAEERQTLLLAELDHRVKNMLAVVQSVVMQTRTSAQSLDGFAVALEGRLHAMARTHSLLTQSRWEGARLDAIVAEELSPYSGETGRVSVAGPELVLRPKAAMALSLACHELATNAAKYGSLSRPGGRVHVVWTVVQGCVRLSWTESGGPPVKRPERRGFGLQAIERILGYELSGRAQVDFHPGGLSCRIEVPARELVGCVDEDASAGAAEPAPVPLPGSSRRRILVVEDSALIALEIEEAVRNLGFDVLGPVGRLSAAMELAQTQPVDGALLDINLDGVQVYPVADLLRERGVPIVFATGYDRRTVLPARFESVPTLAKPFSPSELARLLATTVKAA
jgi:PAS domain S-box-containing protein